MTTEYMSSEESVSEEEYADNQPNSGSDSEVEESTRKSLCTKPLLWKSECTDGSFGPELPDD